MPMCNFSWLAHSKQFCQPAWCQPEQVPPKEHVGLFVWQRGSSSTVPPSLLEWGLQDLKGITYHYLTFMSLQESRA